MNQITTKLNELALEAPAAAAGSFEDPSDEKREPIPMKSGFALYPYQNQVVRWMAESEASARNGIRGGAVCLKMGMGKTVITLQHIINQRFAQQEAFPTLVVMSKTLLCEWRNQGVLKFFPTLKALYFHKDIIGAKDIKQITGREMSNYDIVFTTYDVMMTSARRGKYVELISELGEVGIHAGKVVAVHHRMKPRFNPGFTGICNLHEMPWARIVCDESQRFANPKTATFKSVMACYARNRWCLTGTPIRNYDTDIWAQLRFCGFSKIIHARKWRKTHFETYSCQQHLYILDYTQAGIEMPEKKKEVHVIEMEEQQELIYTTMLEKLQNTLSEYLKGRKVSYMYVLALFTRLRQIAISPHLLVAKKAGRNKAEQIVRGVIEETCSEANKIEEIDSVLGVGSPKIQKMVEVVQSVPKEEKILIFSMFTSALEICERALDQAGITSGMLIGTTNVRRRLEIMEQFKEQSEIKVLLIHYRVGGEGLNLIEANHVIPLEPWWSPAVHDQGIHRAWRTGQKKAVTVHWLLMKQSIETHVLQMCVDKEKMSNSYLYGVEEIEKKGAGLSQMQMLRMLQGSTSLGGGGGGAHRGRMRKCTFL